MVICLNLVIDKDRLENIFRSLEASFNDVNLRIVDDGVKIKEVSADTAILINLEVPKTSFEEFEAENQEIGVHNSDIYSFLREISADKIEISIEENRLYFSWNSGNFSVPILDSDSEDVDVDSFEYNFSSLVNLDELDDCCSFLAKIESPIKFIVSEDMEFLEIQSSSNRTSGERFVKMEDASGDSASSLFGHNLLMEVIDSLGYLKNNDSMISLKFSQDQPLYLRGNLEDIKAQFFLSPRLIEDDL